MQDEIKIKLIVGMSETADGPEEILFEEKIPKSDKVQRLYKAALENSRLIHKLIADIKELRSIID